MGFLIVILLVLFAGFFLFRNITHTLEKHQRPSLLCSSEQLKMMLYLQSNCAQSPVVAVKLSSSFSCSIVFSSTLSQGHSCGNRGHVLASPARDPFYVLAVIMPSHND
jgi:hypothetical protein